MPFSSVVGAQSIVKPGVCTSSTKPASPYDGQVIYMTDVDQTAVWDGSAWVGLERSRDRNVIINGAMQIAQRGTSVAGVTSNGYYTADRFSVFASSLGTWTQSVENDAPTGSGFRKSLKMLCTTANASPTSFDNMRIAQVLEGQNLQHFAKGSASAKQFTLSFWVKSNVTGTCVTNLVDADNSRSVSASYTISASNTWEKKTIIFPADTTGAFDNDNAASLRVFWWLGAGSGNTSGTLNTVWETQTEANRAVGQTNLAAATNNYWQITGVQLEAGAVATPFEFEDYAITLQKCERYFRLIKATGQELVISSGFYFDSNLTRYPYHFPTMRVGPTPTYIGTANTDYKVLSNGGAQTGFSFTHEKSGPNSIVFGANKTSHGLTNTPTLALCIFPTGAIWLSAEL